MLKLTDFAAIIFDMDGLVLDTESTYRIAWQQSAQAMGFSLTDEFCSSLSGLQSSEVESRMLNRYGANFDPALFNQHSSHFWHAHVQEHGIKIKPGFTQLHEFIVEQQIRYCLATNSHATHAYRCLELAGIQETFPLVITGDQVQQGKPAPDIFLSAAKSLRVPIEWCLIVEDSATGIEAAVQAGAFSVFIPSTEAVDSKTVDRCDWLMPDLLFLLEALR